MKTILTSSHNLSRLFIIEQIREPLSLFWSLIAPPTLFMLLNFDSLINKNTSSDWYTQQASWYLSYLAASVSLFGFSMYLVGRRESRFIKSFIQGKKAKFIFLLSQINATLALSIIYFTIFIALTTTIFEIDFVKAFTSLLIPFLIIMTLFIWSATIISVIPTTFMNANTGVSIALMTMLVISLAGLKGGVPGLSYFSLFNPISIGAQFMSGNYNSSIESTITIFVMLISGGFGATLMRTNPIWSKQ